MPTTISGTSGVTFPNSDVQGTGSIGVGQTWQDVSSSRSSGTTYTNSTGRPICVNVTGVGAATGSVSLEIAVNGVVIARNTVYGSGSSYRPFVSAIVPSGSTYTVASFGSGTPSIERWFELR